LPSASQNLFPPAGSRDRRGLDQQILAGAGGLPAATLLDFQIGEVPAPGVTSLVTRGREMTFVISTDYLPLANTVFASQIWTLSQDWTTQANASFRRSR